MPGRNQASLIGLCLLVAGASCRVAAQDDLPFYGGFALGFASASDTNCDYYGYNCDGNNSAFKVFAGKRLHENLAVEIAYYDVGKLKNTGGLANTTADTQALNLSLLGIIPTGTYGYIYGKAGATASDTDISRSGASESSSSDSRSDFSYGIGYAFTFGGKYDLRIEYENLYELGDEYDPGGSTVSLLNFAGTIYIQ